MRNAVQPTAHNDLAGSMHALTSADVVRQPSTADVIQVAPTVDAVQAVSSADEMQAAPRGASGDDVRDVVPPAPITESVASTSVLAAEDDFVDVSHVPRRVRKRKVAAIEVGAHGEARILRSAFSRKCVDYIIYNSNNSVNLHDFLDSIRPQMQKILTEEIKTKKSLKSNLMLVSNFVSPNTAVIEFGHKTMNHNLLSELDVDSYIEHQYAKLMEDFDSRSLNGSGYTQDKIKYLELRITQFKLLPGASYIELPAWLKNRNAVLNPKTKFKDCFKIAILSKHCRGLARANRPRRLAEFEGMYNWNIPMPPTVKDIRKFCTLNKTSINIFGIEKKEIFAMELAKTVKRVHYNLLYIENGIGAHFCLITSMSRLLSRQLTRDGRKKHFCFRCMLRFSSNKNLKKHIKQCGNEPKTTIKLPDEPTYYKFTNYAACQLSPIVITLDLETFCRPISSCEPNPKNSFTHNTNQHVPCSFGAYLWTEEDVSDISEFPLGFYGRVIKNELLLQEEFIEYFEKVARSVKLLYSRNYPISMSQEAEAKCRAATKCYICGKAFSDQNLPAKDHNHLRQYDNFRGCACISPCNIQMSKWKFVPVYTHGSSSFDNHFYIKYFSAKKLPIKIVPSTSEKFMCIEVEIEGVKFKILDSFKLFGSSLASVVESLPESAMIETKKTFNPILASLLTRKGVFCYSFISKPSRLNYRQYPSKRWFFNDLNNTEISDEEYERGRQIWIAGVCMSVADFLLIYQMSDVTLNCDMIIHFRNIFYDKFKLDCCAFLSMPHMSINCFLKYSGMRIEIMNESMTEAYEMVNRGTHGGVAQCVTRFVECGNGTEAFFFDIISLYNYVMAEFPLAEGEYQFVGVDACEWMKVDALGSHGYILECDFEFPESIHQLMQDYPIFPENKRPPNCSTNRLICDLENKKDYVLTLSHYQQALTLGVICTKISRVLKFKQSKYMSNYVKILSKWKQEASSSASGSYFKYANNSCFGKFLERSENRRKLHVVTCEKKLERLVRKPTFVDRHIYDFQTSQMVMVELSQGVITEKRPKIVGMLILSYAKLVMVNYWYNVFKKHLGHKGLKMTMTDTDSIGGTWQTHDPIEDLRAMKSHFDWSGVDVDHPLYSKENYKKMGKFKCECAGRRILAVACPRTKAYSIKLENKDIKKLKGIKKSYVENNMTFEHYKRCVLENENHQAKFKSIVSNRHLVYTADVSKLGLNSEDRKRVVLENGIDSLPYGHKDLKK